MQEEDFMKRKAHKMNWIRSLVLLLRHLEGSLSLTLRLDDVSCGYPACKGRVSHSNQPGTWMEDPYYSTLLYDPPSFSCVLIWIKYLTFERIKFPLLH